MRPLLVVICCHIGAWFRGCVRISKFRPDERFLAKPIYDGFTNQVPPARYKTRTDTRSKKSKVVTCMLYWEDGLRVRDIHSPGRLASPRVKNLHRRCCRRRGRRRQSMFPYVVVRDQEKAIRRDLVGLSSCSWRSYLGTEYACLFAEILLPVKSLQMQMPAILRTYHYYYLLVLPIPTSTCINLWISNVATRFGHNRVTKA